MEDEDDPVETDDVFEAQAWVAAAHIRRLDQEIHTLSDKLKAFKTQRREWQKINQNLESIRWDLKNVQRDGQDGRGASQSSDLSPTQ